MRLLNRYLCSKLTHGVRWRAEAGSYLVISKCCSHWTLVGGLLLLIYREEVRLRKSISTNDMIILRTRHPRIVQVSRTAFWAKCSLLTVLGANIKTHIEGTCSNLIGLRWRLGKSDSCT